MAMRNGRAQWAHSDVKVIANDACLNCPCTKGSAKVSIAQGE